jgi:ribosomal protein S18 acetylase RimI-like enzyme
LTGALYALYVLPSRQRQGCGRRLVQAVARRLVASGMRSVLVWVLAANIPARRFYEALGGAVVREQPIEIGGATLTEVAYGWPDGRRPTTIGTRTASARRRRGKGSSGTA